MLRALFVPTVLGGLVQAVRNRLDVCVDDLVEICLLQLGPHGVSHSLGHGGFRERGPLALFGDFSAAPGLLQKLRLVNVEGNRGKGLLDFLISLFPVVDQAFPLR